MLKIIKHLATVGVGGAYNYIFEERYIGKFLGLKMKYGTFTTGTVQIVANSGSLNRSLYQFNNPTTTDFLHLRVRARDAAGNILTDYEPHMFNGDYLRVQISGGIQDETLEFEFLFDIDHKL